VKFSEGTSNEITNLKKFDSDNTQISNYARKSDKITQEVIGSQLPTNMAWIGDANIINNNNSSTTDPEAISRMMAKLSDEVMKASSQRQKEMDDHIMKEKKELKLEWDKLKK
jgi:hypothetical protein